MKVSDFDYNLPQHFIAQEPIEPRDASRLMVFSRKTGVVEHRIFRDIGDYLQAGDVLVMNNTRVIPARLPAIKSATGGKAEVLLLRQLNNVDWLVMVGGRRILTDSVLGFAGSDITATVIEERHEAQRIVRFSQPVNDLLADLGEMPLPPYIHHRLDDAERYQTIYSEHEGSAAAPTAGLHFTPALLNHLRAQGIRLAYCTLHIGLDTFQPVKVDDVEDHQIHSEYAELDAENAAIINAARAEGQRIIAVGTTSARTLESAAILNAGANPADPGNAMPDPEQPVKAFAQDTRLFIYPGYQWRAVDGLITNFHLPQSTLLMMISALTTREKILAAYETAKREGYRFFSFGDAMFII